MISVGPLQGCRYRTDSPRSSHRLRSRNACPVLGRWHLRQCAIYLGISRVGCLPDCAYERRRYIRAHLR